MLTEMKLRNAPESDYMNPLQTAFFRRRLLAMRRELIHALSQAEGQLLRHEPHADECDQANASSEWWNALTRNSRDTDKLREVDAALQRIASGSYGYCMESGERIGIARLLAYPVAQLSMEVMVRREHQNRLGYRGSRPVMSYA